MLCEGDPDTVLEIMICTVGNSFKGKTWGMVGTETEMAVDLTLTEVGALSRRGWGRVGVGFGVGAVVLQRRRSMRMMRTMRTAGSLLIACCARCRGGDSAASPEGGSARLGLAQTPTVGQTVASPAHPIPGWVNVDRVAPPDLMWRERGPARTPREGTETLQRTRRAPSPRRARVTVAPVSRRTEGPTRCRGCAWKKRGALLTLR